MKQNYIAQLNLFGRWLETHYLSANAQLLWYKLISLFNACGWVDWVQVDTLRLMLMINSQTSKTAYRARDDLVASGLLEVRKGKKGSPSQYHLVYFLCKNYTENDTENDTNNVPNVTQETTHINKHKHKQKHNEEIYKEIVDLFNSICLDLPHVRDITESRKRAILSAKDRVEEYGGWEKMFRTVQASDFLTGRNGSWSGCGFDWILKPANLTKIMEGTYRNKDEASDVPHASYDIDEMEHRLLHGEIVYKKNE